TPVPAPTVSKPTSPKGGGAGATVPGLKTVEAINTELALGGTIIAAWQIGRSLKTSEYSFRPVEFNDHLGTFIVEGFNRGLLGVLRGQGWEYRKTYLTGRPGYTEQITKKAYDAYTAESHRLYGYLDWKGDFVPGELQKAPLQDIQ